MMSLRKYINDVIKKVHKWCHCWLSVFWDTKGHLKGSRLLLPLFLFHLFGTGREESSLTNVISGTSKPCWMQNGFGLFTQNQLRANQQLMSTPHRPTEIILTRSTLAWFVRCDDSLSRLQNKWLEIIEPYKRKLMLLNFKIIFGTWGLATSDTSLLRTNECQVTEHKSSSLGNHWGIGQPNCGEG